MSDSATPTSTACRPAAAPPTTSPTPAAPAPGVTAYDCGPGEAAAFRAVAARHGVQATVTGAAVSEATASLARGSRCVSVSHRTPVTAATLAALGRVGVEYLSTRSIGRDHVDLAAAARLGIRVGTVEYSPDGVADFTVMLVLVALRRAVSIVRRTDLRDYRLGEAPGRELRDLTVGVVGTGRIGSAVIDRLRGFGCRVLACDESARGRAAATYVGLDELLRRSDVVTLHVPLDERTHHLLDARRIALLPDGAVVVNTARGALVDTAALLAALEGDRLGGAALDVLEGEEGVFYADLRGRPVPNEALVRLQRRPDVFLSPHTAFHTDRALADMVENSLLGCLAFAGGGAA